MFVYCDRNFILAYIGDDRTDENEQKTTTHSTIRRLLANWKHRCPFVDENNEVRSNGLIIHLSSICVYCWIERNLNLRKICCLDDDRCIRIKRTGIENSFRYLIEDLVNVPWNEPSIISCEELIISRYDRFLCLPCWNSNMVPKHPIIFRPINVQIDDA